MILVSSNNILSQITSKNLKSNLKSLAKQPSIRRQVIPQSKVQLRIQDADSSISNVRIGNYRNLNEKSSLELLNKWESEVSPVKNSRSTFDHT